MENHQLLLSLYNELDEALRQYYNDNNYSKSVIMRFIKDLENSGSTKYEEYGRTLNMIRVIRNDLIHELDMNSKNLISVSDETINFLKDTIESIKHPIFAKDICTKFDDLVSISISNKKEKVVDIIKNMRSNGFSQLPVIGENDVLYGVFSPNVLFEYIKSGKANIEDTTLEDIEEYLPINKHFSESYLFVDANMNVRKISELFINNFKGNMKPSMVFVTKNGGSKEPIIGIIVASDIVESL